ncbi:NUDIX hydrolase [Acinetobacter sp. TGL-Y2]|uniref:NUDIX hydrolase n=1 Tax=Acinetobacter sp. TGL-Y2 TaxID=1407071 RepID=UPI0007A66156|nr:NUDIX domain-containing protein [Acinetobacter sp. TGL-Y2]AMW79658.1 NUDIX hydrolase [Acinetobacter sp. TGL-Y2]
MAFDDFYRMSSHAVIQNEFGQILLLKANYADASWGLPGGGLDHGETIHQALYRECFEELGCHVDIKYLSGAYFHANVNAHAFIFKCQLKPPYQIQLSLEHSAYAWFELDLLSEIQKIRVLDCLKHEGTVISRSF